jgi:hypothetical protein
MYTHNKAWRKRNPAIWQAGKQRYYKQFETGAYNSRQRYTTQEDDMIAGKIYPDRVIAGKIKRTVKAIQIRRGRLKKEINNEADLDTL